MPTGTPAQASSTPIVTTQYSSPGIKSVSLTAANAECGGYQSTATNTISVIVQQQGPSLCTPNATNVGTTGPGNANGGITRVAFGSVDNVSGTSWTTGVVYEDFACDQFSFVSGTDVNIFATLPQPNDQELTVLLDWNRNGTFELPDELMFVGDNINGQNITGSFPMPANAVRNELLRMRFIADYPGRAQPCRTPLIGQVEDYGIVLPLLPLPVELLSLSAKPISGTRDIALDWQTASEVDTWGFSIEHSLDGQQFTSIGERRAQGDSEHGEVYAFRHANVPSGAHYYRLATVDLDGSIDYSEVVSATLSSDILLADAVRLVPNPASTSVSLVTSLNVNDVMIFDVTGRLVLQRKFSSEPIDVAALKAGVYSILIRSDRGEDVQRLVIR